MTNNEMNVQSCDRPECIGRDLDDSDDDNEQIND